MSFNKDMLYRYIELSRKNKQGNYGELIWILRKLIIGTVILILSSGCSGTAPDLGINEGRLTPCPKTPNCVNSQAIGEKQYVQPIRYEGTQQEARSRLLKVLESEDRTKILTARENYIRATFTSAFFRFIDDVEFYFPQSQTGEAVIHIRSASRIGYSDFGANRKRMERIRGHYQYNDGR